MKRLRRIAARRRLGVGRWLQYEPQPGDPYLRPLPGMRILLALEAVYNDLSGGKHGYVYCVAGATVTWHVFQDGYVTSSVEEAEDRMYELIYSLSHSPSEVR